jgi:transposase
VLPLRHSWHPPKAESLLQGGPLFRGQTSWTTKILALTDALSNLVRFELLPGQRYDTVGVAPLIEGVAFGGLIADKAFDVDWIVAELDERGAQVVISQHPRRTKPRPVDADLYKWRHLIENFFGKLKDFKRIALRACKTDASFAAMIYAAATIINSQ